MINYGRVYGAKRPDEVEITNRCVFVASNITASSKIVDGIVEEGYVYNYIGYTKDEYLKIIDAENSHLKSELLDTQSALCDIYEALEGGLE